MGVHNLWKLLEPVGRRVDLATLRNKVVAVDASIWLTQFVKAMRNADGEVLPNAHIVGTFRRVMKLLLYRIRPIFVFDGGVPTLKKRTILRRQEKRSVQESKHANLLRKLLLKRARDSDAKAKEINETPKFTAKSTQLASMGAAVVAVAAEGDDDHAPIPQVKRMRRAAVPVNSVAETENRSTDSDSDPSAHGEDQTVPLLPDNADVDLSVVASLPPQMQKEYIEELRRSRRNSARSNLIAVAANPSNFSSRQLESFLELAHFNRQVDEVHASQASQVQGRKIASEADREYLLIRSPPTASSTAAQVVQPEESKPSELDQYTLFALSHGRRLARGRGRGRGRGGKRMRLPQVKVDEKTQQMLRYIETHGNSTDSGMLGASLHRLQSQGASLTELISGVWGQSTTREAASTSAIDSTCSAEADVLEVNVIEEDEIQVDEPIDLADVGSLEQEQGATATPAASQDEQMLPSVDEALRDGECSDDKLSHDNVVELDQEAAALLDMCSDGESVDGGGFIVEDDQHEPTIKDSARTVSPTVWDTYRPLQQPANSAVMGMEPFGVSSADLKPGVSATCGSIGGVEERKECDTSDEVPKNINAVVMVSVDDDEWEDVQAERQFDDGQVDQQQSGDQHFDSSTYFVSSSIGRTVASHPPTHNHSPSCVDLASFVPHDGERLDHEADIAVEVVSSSDTANVLRTDNGENPAVVWTEEGSAQGMHSAVDNESALSTAYHLAGEMRGWAKNAFRRTLRQHGLPVPKQGGESPTAGAAPSSTTTPPRAVTGSPGQARTRSPARTPGRSPAGSTTRWTPPRGDVLDDEESQLHHKLRNASRDADTVTDSMREEVIALLQLFGLPHIIAPMEAEAQCAELERLGIVDGVVTDDSDAFLFGAQNVYRNIFDDKKYVEMYLMDDIERELGLDREAMIRSALLLGSDYTDGVTGVGPVNATEIIATFPNDDGLERFRDWLHSVGTDFQPRSDAEAKFFKSHKAARSSWIVPDSFPSQQVLKAYREPNVMHLDPTTSQMNVNLPNFASLKIVCMERFGWDGARADAELKPLIKEYSQSNVQLTLDSFLLTYNDHDRAAKVKSKRLKGALMELSTQPVQDMFVAARPAAHSPSR